MAFSNQAKAKLMWEHNNVVGGRLYQFSTDPPTGFSRDGYCRVVPEDTGNHSVAATITQPFLEFTQSKGNNLDQSGVKAGMKWCLCASRWKEAYDAFQNGELSKDAVPKVHLHATDQKALDVLAYGDLSAFKAEGEATSHRSRQQGHFEPGTGSRGWVREVEISGTRPQSDQQGLASNKATEVGGGTGTG